MKKARLFYTTWGSPRRAILSLALIGVVAAALVFWLGATPAFARSASPDPVSNLEAAAGDTEVKRFTTTATSDENDSEPSEQAKKPPKRPRKLRISASGSSAKISWKPARSKGKGALRCEHSHFAMYFGNRSDPFNTAFPVRRYIVTSPQTVTGLTSGTKYEVAVFSYSVECSQYSAALKKTYIQP